MKKIFTLGIILFMAATTAWAGHIDGNRAREIAVAFFSNNATRSTSCDVVLEWAGRDIAAPTVSKSSATSNDALLYIFNRSDEAGFVIIAGEECANPIIAYSDRGCFDVNNMAPSTRAILSAWSRQIEAMPSASTSAVSVAALAAAGHGNEICYYNTALWDQSEPYNRECPVIDGYTTLTGCVATAMAIVCYYNRWPERGVGTTQTYSYYDDYNNYHSVPSNTLGRSYNYDNMLHNYAYGYTSSQGDAVAALMYDLGTSVQMEYHYGASGTFSEYVPAALINHFGYSKEATLLYRQDFSVERWNRMLRENLEKCGPTYYSGVGDAGGHAFIVDGCTDKDYFHFNFGWSGYNNGYYLTPNIEFYDMQDAIFNLVPDRDGTSNYRDYMGLIEYNWNDTVYYCGIECSTSEFEVGVPFNVTAGCFCNFGTNDFNGVSAVAVCDKDDNIKQILQERALSLYTKYITYASYYDLTIEGPLVTGDKLRIVYKGEYSDDWQIMYGTSESVIDEVVLSASSENIADAIALRYEKGSNGKRTITIESSIDVKYSCVKQPNNVVYALGSCDAYDKVTIEFDSSESGSYTLNFNNADSTYSIALRL